MKLATTGRAKKVTFFETQCTQAHLFAWTSVVIGD